MKSYAWIFNPMKHIYRAYSDAEGYMTPDGIQAFNQDIKDRWDMIHTSTVRQRDFENEYFEELYTLEKLAESRHFTLVDVATMEHLGDGYKAYVELQRRNENLEKSQLSFFDIDYSRVSDGPSADKSLSKSGSYGIDRGHSAMCNPIYMMEGDADEERSL